MDHIGILKAADHMYNSVYFSDIGKELISQPFPLGRAFYKSGDIHKFDHRRRYLFGMIKISQKLQSLIRHCNHAHIGIDGTEGIICRLGSRLCQRIEQCTFSNVRKSDDS